MISLSSKSVAKIRQDFRLSFLIANNHFYPDYNPGEGFWCQSHNCSSKLPQTLERALQRLPQHSTTLADPTIQSAANTAAPSVACSTHPVIPDDVRATVTVVAKQPIVCVRSRLPFSFSQANCLHLPAVCVASPLLHSDWCGIQGTHSTSHGSYLLHLLAD